MIQPIPYPIKLISKRFYLLFFGLFALSASFAQTIERKCYEGEEYYDKAAHQQLEIFTKKYIKNQQYIASSRGAITIPVVVHVVYPTEKENISDEQIHSQIDALNRDFNRQNENLDRVHSDFKSIIADVGFNFCLATVDPTGQATTGITRTNVKDNFVYSIGDKGIYRTEDGGKTAWDTNRYLNIWVTKMNINTAGFGSKPNQNQPNEDGVIINSDYFGQLGTALPNYQLGRTTTHEVGHYFNLYHPFSFSLGCEGDDFVADVPQQLNPYQGACPTGDNMSCGSRDNASNFMNYSHDECLAMFTQGQARRMQAALIGARSGLLNGNKCQQTTTPNLADGIKVYPNPASYYFCIEVDDSNLEQIPYTVFNAQGAKVEEGLVFPNSLQHFPTYRNGIYFIQFMDGSEKGLLKKVLINNK